MLPSDIADSPYAIQSDIIGVSGSSGSPLVDPNTSWVIGLAQNVIPSNFELKIDESIRKNFNDKEKLEGEVSTGLVWGDACTRFYEFQI